MLEIFILGCIYAHPAYRDLVMSEGRDIRISEIEVARGHSTSKIWLPTHIFMLPTHFFMLPSSVLAIKFFSLNKQNKVIYQSCNKTWFFQIYPRKSKVMHILKIIFMLDRDIRTFEILSGKSRCLSELTCPSNILNCLNNLK